MNPDAPLPSAAPAASLAAEISPLATYPAHRLSQMRRALMAVMAAALAVMHWGLDLRFPPTPVLAAFVAWAGLELVWSLRIRGAQAPGVASTELLAHLLADAAALAALLYFTGGYTNPLISLLLAPLALGATFLDARRVWLLAAAIAALYSALVVANEPLGIPPHRTAQAVWLHLVGMWLAFVVSALLLAGLVARLSSALREREHEIGRLREAALRREQVLGLGLMAAGAAHELGTPLATMAVVTEELEFAAAAHPDLQADIATLRSQIARCKQVLERLRRHAARPGADADLRPLPEVLDDFIAQWRLLRPAAPVSLRLPDDARPAWLDPTLRQALANLLDNAADAAASRMDIDFQATPAALWMRIADDGPGIAAEAARLGKAPVASSKPHGLGIGLMLSNASVERLGGRVSLAPQAGGGTLTAVCLPWAALQPPIDDHDAQDPVAGR